KFIREQIAGDLMDAVNDEDHYEKITATGFLVLGPKVLGEPDREKLVMDVADEQIDVTTRAFLGLTVSCARCHDHKFDPIPTKDYYALAGIFKSTRTMQDLGFVSRVMERPLASPEVDAQIKAGTEHVRSLQDELTKLTAAADARISSGIRQDAGAYWLAGLELAREPGLYSLAESTVKPDQRLFIEA